MNEPHCTPDLPTSSSSPIRRSPRLSPRRKANADDTKNKHDEELWKVFSPPKRRAALPRPENIVPLVSKSASEESNNNKKKPQEYTISSHSSGRKGLEKLIGPKYTPRPCDFICGRSEKATMHAGNRRLRDMVASQKKVHANRQEKSEMIRSIVYSVYDAGGGFVRYDSRTGDWYEIGKACAHRKVAGFFRNNDDSNKKTKP